MNKLVDAYMDTLPDFTPVLDPEHAILDLDARLTMAEEQIVAIRNRLAMVEENQRQMAINMVTMLERLKALSTPPAKPAIIGLH